MEVDNDQDPWEAIEGPIAGPVAMDTSSPWGSTSISVSSSDLSAAAPKEAVGWADFGSASFSSGGGEGMGSLIPSSASRIEGVTMDGEREGWSPAMASSPEATMLNERSDRGEGTGSPVLEDRLQQVEDAEVASEDKGSYSGGSTTTGLGGWCTAPTGGGEGGGGGGDGSAWLESQGGEAVPGLNKDQEPVCDSSSQDCTEGSTGGDHVSS